MMPVTYVGHWWWNCFGRCLFQGVILTSTLARAELETAIREFIIGDSTEAMALEGLKKEVSRRRIAENVYGRYYLSRPKFAKIVNEALGFKPGKKSGDVPSKQAVVDLIFEELTRIDSNR